MAVAPIRQRPTWPKGRAVASPLGHSPRHHRNRTKGTSATAERKKTTCPSGTDPPRALTQRPIAAKASVERMRRVIPSPSFATGRGGLTSAPALMPR